MSNQIVAEVVSVLALAIATGIGLLIRGLCQAGENYIEAKVGQTKFQQGKDLVDTLVRGIEQSPFAASFDGAKKKEMVLAQASEYFQAHNIPITSNLLDKMVEASVQAMNATTPPTLTSVIQSAVDTTLQTSETPTTGS